METHFKLKAFIRLGIVLVLLIYISIQASAQEVYVRLLYNKVDPAATDAYVKLMKENVKPALQLAKKNGEVAEWVLYRVHNTGTDDPYNFVTVLVYDNWAKTEKLPNLDELARKANSTAGMSSVSAQMALLRKLVRQELYVRSDLVTNGGSAKYALVGFMKPEGEFAAEYSTIEKTVWNPIHKQMLEAGHATGWALWRMLLPAGSNQSHSYLTANTYSDYSKLTVGYEDAIKKAHPTKKPSEIFAQTDKSRKVVKTELWEIIEITAPENVAKAN